MKVEASDAAATSKRAAKQARGKRLAAEGGSGMKPRRRGHRVLPPSDAIQRLYLACKSVFKGPATVPDPAGVEMLKLLLDGMKPDDVGLSMDIPFFKSKPRNSEGTPRITCAKIKECENFSMCIFFLPPSAVIPLHNHPGMTVFNKLLLGSMHVKSYDWLNPVPSNIPTPSANWRPAKLVVDSDITAPCDTLILYPEKGGNIHTFTAITACAVLDVLGPPYSTKDDGDITYYRDYPCIEYTDDSSDQSGGRDQRIGWLEEIELSEDSKMALVQYMGPPVASG